MVSQYGDIIHLPHPVSTTHPQMPIADRAAQFAPFAALTGYGAAIRETGRLTDEKMELDESEKALLNEQLLDLQARIQSCPMVQITYFLPDACKTGGAYVEAVGAIRKIDGYAKAVILMDARSIPFADIVAIREVCGEEKAIPLP